jgi:hypothetical protein
MEDAVGVCSGKGGGEWRVCSDNGDDGQSLGG